MDPMGMGGSTPHPAAATQGNMAELLKHDRSVHALNQSANATPLGGHHSQTSREVAGEEGVYQLADMEKTKWAQEMAAREAGLI